MQIPVSVSVAIEQKIYHIDTPYSYAVPARWVGLAQPGCRVVVPFGKGNRNVVGIILSVEQGLEFDVEIKSIISVLDDTPLLSADQLSLLQRMKQHTFCTYFDALRIIVPAGVHYRMIDRFALASDWEKTQLSADEVQIVQYLRKNGPTAAQMLQKCIGITQQSNILQTMVNKGVLVKQTDSKQRVQNATFKMVRFVPGVDIKNIKCTPKQAELLRILEDIGGRASVKELCYHAGVTGGVVATLVKHNILETYEQTFYRRPYTAQKSVDTPIALTESQQQAYLELLDKFNAGQGGAALLYGVTGSGKTQVFLKLVDTVLKQGRDVIVMVPEIALTPQTLSLFHARYGEQVAVFHSAMSQGQRMDEWKRVKDGKAHIAVGTRSAVFAPFANLGLIIMDEEQEHTYKSEKSPRYHARDIAKMRIAQSNGLLVLASATPSIETYSNALSGRYTLCTLPNRYGKAVLPKVVTVDMRKELLAGNASPISQRLTQEIDRVLQAKQQVILLLNRRGHNTFISCPTCGHVVTCDQCSISMTYHSANQSLMCHYCGKTQPFTETCPSCQNGKLRYMGAGTQKVEQELGLLYPNARILRMDADSTMTRQSYEKNLSAFAKGEYDIMLGTQMVAKGLDFPNVTLVGVLSADQSMYSEDFRSFERTFSLLTQVVGRAGRGEQAGMAIVQTLQPDHSVVALAAKQDYNAFYEDEILTRKLMIYPPYCDVCVLGVSAAQRQTAQQTAQLVLDYIKQQVAGEYKDVKLIALGPVIASVPRVNNKYRFRIILKCKNNARFREMIHNLLCEFGKRSQRDVSVFADINPEGLL